MKTLTEKIKDTEAEFNKSGKRQSAPSGSAAWSSASSSPANFQIQRKSDCACGGDCPTCQAKHPSLPISHPTDASEIEADQIADKVMRRQIINSENLSASKNTVSRKCSECEEEKLQRKEISNDSTSYAPRIVQDVLSSGGRPLDAAARAFMEPRFNRNFSNVKIHDNSIAAKSADSINALAYTSGNNIVFNSGQYNTNSDSGKRLLAHELAHVIQRDNATVRRQNKPVDKIKKAEERQSKCGSKCGGKESGSVECELNSEGYPTDRITITINETNPCVKPCVEVHEKSHAEDFKPFCKKVHNCIKKSAGDENKIDKCLESYESELVPAIINSECKAYKKGIDCLNKIKSKPVCKSAENKSIWKSRMEREKCYRDCYCQK
jgi:hypothetical protein